MTRMDFYELTSNPIDIRDVARRVVPLECGATVTSLLSSLLFLADRKSVIILAGTV